MPKFRVLVVDDAVVFRRLVSEELARDPALEVVGTAANGRIALARIPQVNPDVVILDVEMPEMDGLTTLAELRKSYPRLPVIMFSALTQRGAEATLDALSLGASDYFTKPSQAGSIEGSLEVIRDQLIPKIKALGHTGTSGKGVGRRESAAICSPSLTGGPLTGTQRRPADTVQIVAIGASTGGPNALAEIFRYLPSGFPVPIVIVQHMPPMFTRLLAERLSAQSAVPVQEAASGTVLQPGHAWIAPGDYHLTVVRDRAQVRTVLHQEPPQNSCRPAADVLFRSVAKAFGPASLNVILTGMGQDGLRGCEEIKEAGGQILAQDECTSVVWGMPGSVVRAGLADRVLPISEIAGEILRRVSKKQATLSCLVTE